MLGTAREQSGSWFAPWGTSTTWMLMDFESVPPAGSATVNVTGYVPACVESGFQENWPVAGFNTAPGGKFGESNVRVSPSGSVAVNCKVNAAPSVTVWSVTGPRVGGSLTGPTVICTTSS